MAGPSEVLEAFIPHLPDAIQETKRRSAMTVLKGLELNGYYIMRRPKSLGPRMDGLCDKCGCNMVYVQHDQTFMEAQQRLDAQQQTITHMLQEAAQMTSFIQAIAEGRIATIEEARTFAQKGLTFLDDGRVKMLPPDDYDPLVPPGHVMQTVPPPQPKP